jgi:cytochrome d ubiquinol oxidase subunit I
MTGTVTALNLARAQFAFTLSFHFIFPAFSIGLASYLAVLEGLWLSTGNAVYENLYRYWIRIFSTISGRATACGYWD